MGKYKIKVNGENITFDSDEMRLQTIFGLKRTGSFYVAGYDAKGEPEFDFEFDESIHDTCCGIDPETCKEVNDCEQCTVYGVSCGGIMAEVDRLYLC